MPGWRGGRGPTELQLALGWGPARPLGPGPCCSQPVIALSAARQGRGLGPRTSVGVWLLGLFKGQQCLGSTRGTQVNVHHRVPCDPSPTPVAHKAEASSWGQR